MNLNKVELIGNLVRDPVIRTLPSGQNIASFTVATRHDWRDQKTKEVKTAAEYNKILAWGKLANVIGKYLKKGHRVYLEGRLQSRRWEDRNGKLHDTVEVIASNLIMLGTRRPAQKTADKDDEIIVEEIDPSQVTE